MANERANYEITISGRTDEQMSIPLKWGTPLDSALELFNKLRWTPDFNTGCVALAAIEPSTGARLVLVVHDWSADG